MTQDDRKQTGAKDSRSPKRDFDRDLRELQERVHELEQSARQAQEGERRALADYQNLVRRTQAESARSTQFATKQLVAELIQPLEHLRLASVQLHDSGLEMVVHQLWQVLEQNGVRQINPLGEEFDVARMEAVEQQGEGTVVIAVRSCGYELHGQVLQHARVVVGSPSSE